MIERSDLVLGFKLIKFESIIMVVFENIFLFKNILKNYFKKIIFYINTSK